VSFQEDSSSVAIARALVHDPRLLICDEPTSALDAETGWSVMEMLRDKAVHPERVVIVVTHDSRIFSFSDRTARMEDGRIVAIDESPAAGDLHAPAHAAASPQSVV
jgi:putative ABC transport system ATP-binding protein